MVFRWFGEGNDRVPLRHVKQIPGVSGIVWALHTMQPGDVWPEEDIRAAKRQIESHGFHMRVVESVNIHEDIKLGLPSRDRYIDNYIETMRRLAAAGVKVICYNFMPVFDWIRTDLFRALEDGSTALFYEKARVDDIDPNELVRQFLEQRSVTLPGWEPERLARLSELFEQYRGVTEERLFANLRYFLERIVPAAEALDIRMALHPDDPPWSVFGLPRIVTNRDNLRRILALVDNPYNGLTLCSGALGANPDNDIPAMIREFGERIHFAHIRNVRRYDNGDFIETSHRSRDGSLDINEIVKAFHDIGYTGYARPDHGRHIWDEECRPGYGLYDRGLGIMYLWGVWDTLEQLKRNGGLAHAAH